MFAVSLHWQKSVKYVSKSIFCKEQYIYFYKDGMARVCLLKSVTLKRVLAELKLFWSLTPYDATIDKNITNPKLSLTPHCFFTKVFFTLGIISKCVCLISNMTLCACGAFFIFPNIFLEGSRIMNKFNNILAKYIFVWLFPQQIISTA